MCVLRKVLKFSQNLVITAVTAGHRGMLLPHGGFLGSEHYLLNQGRERQSRVDCRCPAQVISIPVRTLLQKGQAICTKV